MPRGCHQHRPSRGLIRWSETPGDLRKTEQFSARLGRGEFADQREGCWNISAHGDAYDEGADEQHCGIDRTRDAEDAGRIDQQVVLVDALAPELVAEPARR